MSAIVHDAEFGLERIDDSLQIARIVDAQAQIDGRALDQVDFLSVLAEYRKNIGEPFLQHERKILGADRNQDLTAFENADGHAGGTGGDAQITLPGFVGSPNGRT